MVLENHFDFSVTPSSVCFVNCAVLQQSRKRHMIGYFDSDAAPDYKTYHKVASILRDDCSFHTAIGSAHFSVHTTPVYSQCDRVL